MFRHPNGDPSAPRPHGHRGLRAAIDDLGGDCADSEETLLLARLTNEGSDTVFVFPSFSPTRIALCHILFYSNDSAARASGEDALQLLGTGSWRGYSPPNKDTSITDMHNIELSCAAESATRSGPHVSALYESKTRPRRQLQRHVVHMPFPGIPPRYLQVPSWRGIFKACHLPARLKLSLPRGTTDSPLHLNQAGAHGPLPCHPNGVPSAPRPHGHRGLRAAIVDTRGDSADSHRTLLLARSTNDSSDTLFVFPSFSPTRIALCHILFHSDDPAARTSGKDALQLLGTAPWRSHSPPSKDTSITDMHNIELSCSARAEQSGVGPAYVSRDEGGRQLR